MNLNYLAFAVPLFLFFIGLEYYYSRRKGKGFYQYAESVANLNVGIAERLLDVFTTGAFFYVFDFVHRHWALFSISPGWFTWLLLFLATDLVWYWYHRLAHEINLFWSVHVVHHQSEDFNYTVSARITVLQAVVRSLFWCVLPLIGFPAPMVTGLLLLHGLYPFFIHTQAIGRLGWLEYILVTPSHHRVHHASDAEYLDRNYGDVLIIWDKLFGTFAREDRAPSFGLTKPLNSHSFLWQHFHFFLEMAMAFRHARGWRNKWRTVFGRPDDIDPRFRTLLERRLSNVKITRELPAGLRQYISAQTAVSLFLLFVTILFEAYLSGLQLFLLSAFIMMSLVNSGAMLDQRGWVFYLEFARLLIVLFAIGVFFRNGFISWSIMILVSLLVYNFRPMEKKYLWLLYQHRRKR
ncbi:MAG TPA: sterol desaturase family protein [Flavisolibacter sp.]|nr:sterol desaturase family protein [Flavisolibacter sp.]